MQSVGYKVEILDGYQVLVTRWKYQVDIQAVGYNVDVEDGYQGVGYMERVCGYRGCWLQGGCILKRYLGCFCKADISR